MWWEYVLAICVGIVTWLVLSEIGFRRHERRKAEQHEIWLAKYSAETRRMYGRDRGEEEG